MNEITLRDGEVAVILENNTTMIMNVNSLIELIDKLTNDNKSSYVPGPTSTVTTEVSDEPDEPCVMDTIENQVNAFFAFLNDYLDENTVKDEVKEPEKKSELPFKVIGEIKGNDVVIYSDGRVFGSIAAADKFYNLSRGTCSAIINGRQHKTTDFRTGYRGDAITFTRMPANYADPQVYPLYADMYGELNSITEIVKRLKNTL